MIKTWAHHTRTLNLGKIGIPLTQVILRVLSLVAALIPAHLKKH